MLHFIHHKIVAPNSDAKVEYSILAFTCAAVLNIVAILVSRQKQTLRLFDASSGLIVSFVCIFTLMINGKYYPRQLIATSLMTAWGARLSIYLASRRFQRTSDTSNILSRVIWCFISSIPTVMCNTMQNHRYRSTFIELSGIIMALVGLTLEAFADIQKETWHLNNPVETKAKDNPEAPVCTDGLWHYCRHPNLFGEVLFHWGIYVIVRPADESLVILCPVLLTIAILILPGGIVTKEQERNKQYSLYPAYQKYKKATPVFVPFDPDILLSLESCAPTFWSTACCRFAIYEEAV